jgi:hypothetical protein
MSRNGSGTYNLPAGNPVVTGTTITTTWANSTLVDVANALTGSVAADGQTPVTGNINMTNNKIINLLNPSNLQDAATKDYVDTVAAALGTMATQDADAVDITGGTIDDVAITNGTITDAAITNPTITNGSISNVANVYVGQTTAPHGGVVAAKAAGGNIIAGELTTGGPGTTFISVSSASATNYDHFGAYRIGSPTRLFGVNYEGRVAAGFYDTTTGSSIAANGYTRLVNGLILQWGRSTVTNNGSTVLNFPIIFPNSVLSFTIAQELTNASPVSAIGHAGLTQGGATIWSGNSFSVGYTFIALGT